MSFWILCGATLLFAFGLLTTVRYLVLARASVNWPSTPGTMLECSLVKNSGKGMGTYFARVRYSYVVGGRIYVSTNKAYHLSAGGDEAFVNGHSAGTSVTVFYNPRYPRQATLETGDAYTNSLACVGALVALVVAGYFLAKEWR